MLLCTAADVYNRYGGANKLSQTLDPQGTGTFNISILELAIQDASNQVLSAAGVQSVLSGFTQADIQAKFPELVTLTAQRALYLCWLYGTAGQACPDHIIQLNQSVETELQRLSERKRKHGAVDFSPEPNQRVTEVDNDPLNTRMTLRGFRASGGFI